MLHYCFVSLKKVILMINCCCHVIIDENDSTGIVLFLFSMHSGNRTMVLQR